MNLSDIMGAFGMVGMTSGQDKELDKGHTKVLRICADAQGGSHNCRLVPRQGVTFWKNCMDLS
jgi:hypothetical protein